MYLKNRFLLILVTGGCNNLEKRKHNVTSHVAQVRKHTHTIISTVKDAKLCL